MASKLTTSEVLALVKKSLESTDEVELATAVRLSLDWFAAQHPGKAVELRVPPYRVVQLLGGTTHRRGTPPATIEMLPQKWLELFLGTTTWHEAVAHGAVAASGERSNLSELLPIIDES